jgi:hypothetical protein
VAYASTAFFGIRFRAHDVYGAARCRPIAKPNAPTRKSCAAAMSWSVRTGITRPNCGMVPPLSRLRFVSRRVPVAVRRPLRTPKTRRPLPLVLASRTSTPSRERIPHGSAPLESRLRRANPVTAPAARRRRPPAAQRTPDLRRYLAPLVRRCVDAKAIGDLVVSEEVKRRFCPGL